ncbi:MAG: hypothetical protein HZA24_11895 [Nitrospirae bacterium]|nr:hypothetical protein [Nitrospirota bacterium]
MIHNAPRTRTAGLIGAALLALAGPVHAEPADAALAAALAGPAPVAGPAALLAQGQGRIAAGDAEAGFRDLAQAVREAPGDIALQTYLTAYLDQGAYAGEPEPLRAVLDVLPDFVPALARLAKIHEGRQDMAAAETLYLRWAALRPDQPEAFARLGEHYYFTRRFDKAVSAFERHRELVGESDYVQRRLEAIQRETGMVLAGIGPGVTP